MPAFEDFPGDGVRRCTRPITEDTADPVSVPVLHYLASLPYFAAHQAFDHHADDCRECSGDSAMPCPVGGRLGELTWEAIESQRRKAVCN